MAVTISQDGTAILSVCKLDKPAPKPTAPAPVPAVFSETPAVEQPPAHGAVTDAVASQAPSPAEVIDLTKLEAKTMVEEVEAEARRIWVEGDEEAAKFFDWSKVDVAGTAYEYLERYRTGYPEAMGFWYMPEVLALYGMDFDVVESAMRNPAWVEIRPETKDKGYPILGFHKGDVAAIVGYRYPTQPAILAAYAFSMIENDTHRVDHRGGGGAKRNRGLPSNVGVLLKQLRLRGAHIDVDPSKPVSEVIYRGQSLGQVNTGERTDKLTVQTDWQRMQRKMHAIDQRESAPSHA